MAFPVLGKNAAKTNEAQQTFVGQPRNACLALRLAHRQRHAAIIYRGSRIGDLVAHGTYPAIANLLWTGDWDPGVLLATAPVPPAVLTILRTIPATTKPMDALRTAISRWRARSGPANIGWRSTTTRRSP